MKDFSGKIAVVTGGGNGMGRELTKQLAEAGCSIAICDISEEDMAETVRAAEKLAPQGVRVTSFRADVGKEDQVQAFADHVREHHETDHIHLLINNAGIGGGGSFVTGPRENWERTFNVCWYGVYNNARAFMGMLVAADEAHIVNVSSVNGFWASIGPDTPHTAYSAAKFAVKGFTEALITDLRLNAPHVKASVVMPGHIGTQIALNTLREFGDDSAVGGGNEEYEEAKSRGEQFRDNAITSAEDAARIILDGVRADDWRILIGPDAEAIDEAVRKSPRKAYEGDFGMSIFAKLREAIMPG
ncbi:SDR family NAD(P)-dependent oxidoreductase [Henriciella marina]|uniref:SDR family NAD(P)-dependent oxidoreductase n=1 Tax=Henriciella marina TaxID=453851 RepID=UPI00037028B3|nr:SDR family NAD(P)-dependent oxidoreductase [Henriciella marina]